MRWPPLLMGTLRSPNHHSSSSNTFWLTETIYTIPAALSAFMHFFAESCSCSYNVTIFFPSWYLLYSNPRLLKILSNALVSHKAFPLVLLWEISLTMYTKSDMSQQAAQYWHLAISHVIWIMLFPSVPIQQSSIYAYGELCTSIYLSSHVQNECD